MTTETLCPCCKQVMPTASQMGVTPAEYAAVERLFAAPEGVWVSAVALGDAILPFARVVSSTRDPTTAVRQIIHKLRAKVSDDFIDSRMGRGYRLSAGGRAAFADLKVEAS